MDKTQELQLLKTNRITQTLIRKPEIYFNYVELNCFIKFKEWKKNESKRKVWLSEMMISRIQSFIGYCLQFAHKAAMILLLDALCCIWRPCGTQHSEQSLCAVLCVVMLTFRLGLAMISCWPWWKGHRTCVMDLATGTIAGKSSLLHSHSLIPCSADIHVSTKPFTHALRIVKCSTNKTIQLHYLIFSHARSLIRWGFYSFLWGV